MAKKNLILLILFTFLFPSNLFPAKRALIIGIDRYLLNDKYRGELNLIGCTNDALDLEKLLAERYGFKENETRVLLNKNATREAILEGLRWLVKETKSQDWIFFSFSGHGTQIPDKNGDEEDGKDECICPSDVEPVLRLNFISDDEINEFIKKLKDRRAFFLFDSCHSGTMKRGRLPHKNGLKRAGYYARLLPPPSLLKKKTETSYRGEKKILYYVKPDRVIKTGVDFAQGSGEIVVYSASAPHQVALPVNTTTGHPNGAMTYAVLRGIEGAADINHDDTITYRELLEFSRKTIKELLSKSYIKRKGLEQEPQVDSEPGKIDRPLFFLTPQAELSNLINKSSSFRITLRLHGKTSNEIKLKEHVSYYLESEKSGYLYLFAIAPDGEVTCLFPNLSQKDNYIREGEGVVIPPPDADFAIEAVEPTGKMRTLALVTSRYLDLTKICKRKEEELLHTLGSDELKELVRITRGIPGVFSPAEWAAAVMELEVVR